MVGHWPEPAIGQINVSGQRIRGEYRYALVDASPPLLHFYDFRLPLMIKSFSSWFLSASLLLLVSACLPEPDTSPDLWETISVSSEYTILTEGMRRMGYDKELQAGYEFTLFAPNDEGFSAWLAARNYNSIAEVPRQDLAYLLRYHMQFGRLDIANLGDGFIRTLCPKSPDSTGVVMLVRRSATSVILNDTIEVIRPNTETRTGLLQELNGVVRIPRTWELIRDNPIFSTMEEAITRAGLTGLFLGSTPYTLLGVSNSAFDAYFTDNNLAGLSELTDEQVKTMVQTHIIEGNFTYEEFAQAVDNYYTNLAGTEVRISSATAGQMIINSTIGAPIINVQGSNGVIHVLSRPIE